MADTKTLSESTRSPVDGTEGVRLATTGANWVATLAAIFGTTTGITDQIKGVGVLTAGATGAGFTIALTTSTVTGTLAAARLPAFTGGDVTSSAGSASLAIGSTKVTSAMLNADVYSTAHSWGGTQTFTAPVLGTPASGTLTNCTGLPESVLTFTDITTNNVSTTKHGFAPKSPNDATKYLDGTGAYSVPAGSGGTLTANSTATSGFTAGQILYSDGSLLQASAATLTSAGAFSGTTVTGSGIVKTTSAGSAAAPSLVVGNATTGFYSVSTTGFGISVNGVLKIDWGITAGSATTLVGPLTCGAINTGANNIVNTGTSNYIGTISSFFFAAHGSGIVELCGASLTGTGFGRLQFGGTTSSFPAIKRNNAALNFRVADDTADAAITAAAITGSGLISSTSATGGIGYATGAGGVVTQATNKSTGVTLNTVTGQITMNNASLAGQTEVSFTLTNSAIAATDVVLVSIASGATANSYVVGVAATAAGSCVIQLGNVTLATALGEAVVLNFVVIKGVTS